MIRKATIDDAKAVSALLAEINDLHIRLAPSRYKISTEEFNLSFITKYLAEEMNTLLVAEKDDHVVGVAFLSVKNQDDNGPTKNILTASLDTIIVSNSQRRNGLGKELFVEAEKTAKQKDCTALKINVAVENNEAFKFYKNLGYKESDIQLIKQI